jgi:CRP-like cAMP-binding protein
LLQQIPLFDSLDRSELKRLAKLLQSRSLKKREVLFRKGDPGSDFFIIIKGSIKIGVSKNLDEEVIFSFLGSGDCFGEMALLDNHPRSADATAVEDSLLYVLDSKDFYHFLLQSENTVRSVIGALLRLLSLRLRRADHLLEEISFLTVPARLARRLLELAESIPTEDRKPEKCLIRI